MSLERLVDGTGNWRCRGDKDLVGVLVVLRGEGGGDAGEGGPPWDGTQAVGAGDDKYVYS